jgi:predicted amidohydrolase YtcJ
MPSITRLPPDLGTPASLSVAAAVLLLAACSPSHAPRLEADLILTGASAVTVDPAFTVAQGVAIRQGIIIGVGSDREVLAFRGPGTRVLELEGKTVLPGLIDSHIHFLTLGRDVQRQAELTFAMSAGEILDAVVELKERLDPEPGEWLVGNRWDQYKYPEMVTRWQLDSVAPENPVYLNRVYRGVAVSTAVFNLMGIHDDRPETWPAWWLQDPSTFTFEDRIFRAPREVTAGGQTRVVEVPTGTFVGSRASALVTLSPPTGGFEDDVESVRYGVEEMLSLGVTGVVDPSSRMGYLMRVYQEAYNRGYMKLRMGAVLEGTFTTHDPEAIRRHFDAIKINNLGDRYLRWRGSKFYSDGGAGTRSAWVSRTFERWEEFEGRENLGYPVVADNAVREAQYRAAVDYGWDLHTHVAGDVAMRQAVDLYMKLMDEVRDRRPDADLRWSLIHAYLPIEEGTRVLEDMARYGIMAAANPVFQWQEGVAFAVNLGEDRMARTQPFRSYMEGGVVMTSGSDFPVTSHDPWIGIYALLTRRDQATGTVHGADETVGIADALRSYTINGAYATYDEEWKGSIEVGKVADLVVVDLPDIGMLEKDPELCFSMRDRVLLTLVDGEVRFRRPGGDF